MEHLTKSLLNRIQNDFPLQSRPFLALANELNTTEDEIIRLIKELKEEGYVRRIGGIFDSKNLGYTSALCAMEVPENNIEGTAQLVSSYEGVTHNYLRKHRYNMWFTVIGANEASLQKVIDEIKDKTGIKRIMILKAVNTFKIKVNLKLEGE